MNINQLNGGYITTQEFTWKKKWIFKQSAAPTLTTLAGAANGLRPLAARGLAGIKVEKLTICIDNAGPLWGHCIVAIVSISELSSLAVLF